MCSDMRIKNKKDKTLLFNNLAVPVALIIQYDNDNKKKDNSSLSLVKLCDMMLDKSLGSPVSILLIYEEFNNLYNNVGTYNYCNEYY